MVHTFQTKDGIPIKVRPLLPGDAAYLVDIFQNMGQESRYTRFNVPMPDPDPDAVQQEAAEMANFERPESDGWVAFADLPGKPDVPVAGIRYIRTTAEGEAEVSISVRDDMQNKGIGTALLLFLFEQARKAGLTRLVALVQRNNRPLWQILKKAPVPLKRTPDGSYVFLEFDL
ncbi:MAG: GNAT family N-acetyltransferase [Candidatus Promineifilaceae bacterium]